MCESGSRTMCGSRPRTDHACVDRGRNGAARLWQATPGDDEMNPNMTVSYLADRENRQRLERGSRRGWLASELAANVNAESKIQGADFHRLRETVRSAFVSAT